MSDIPPAPKPATPLSAIGDFADKAQYPLLLTLALPVIGMVAFLIVVHLILRRTHTAFKDAVTPASLDRPAKADPSKADATLNDPITVADTFIAQNPPQNMPSQFANKINIIRSGADVRTLSGDELTIDHTTNELVVKFRSGFHAVHITALCSYELTVLHRELPSTVVAMGYARFPFPEGRLPGWHAGSVGFHTNLRKFADRGGFVGHSFPMLPSDDFSIPKNQSNTYTITVNPRASEVYISQGSGTFRFHRVLAQAHELRLGECPYFPMIGANGKCTVRIRPFIPSDEEVEQLRREAWNMEQQFVRADGGVSPAARSHRSATSGKSAGQPQPSPLMQPAMAHTTGMASPALQVPDVRQRQHRGMPDGGSSATLMS
ncbi:hypothetical protein BCR44DRAFT_33642 [Catenaria anguillulae PL171]|uniref:SPRY domain-containing protein n=1 Tax=Catenaria anguillulae PL171 TaxID=765915 RepID=A0A1Y2HJQ4_9FUNG|nr:hypothetical protein BCR44DRAFT_33642 [Catenaria anguillulae PL171]